MNAFRIILIFGLVMLSILCIIEGGYYCGNRKIAWSEEEPLSWDSFKRFPDLFDTYEAAIHSNIEYKLTEDSLRSIEIKAYAYPYKSYAILPFIRSEALLKHERYHFNITELFARKFEQTILSVDSLPPKSIIDSIYYATLYELNEAQDLFDLDTQHSVADEIQEQWFAIIDTLLNKTAQTTGTRIYDYQLEDRYSYFDIDEIVIYEPQKPTLNYFYNKAMGNDDVRLQLEYHNNGNIRSEVVYRNNKPDGFYVEWYEDGDLYQYVTYENGVREGYSCVFDKDGNLLEDNLYENNSLDVNYNIYK